MNDKNIIFNTFSRFNDMLGFDFYISDSFYDYCDDNGEYYGDQCWVSMCYRLYKHIGFIHQNYVKAMTSRRTYTLPFERFVKYVTRNDVYYYRLGMSYIFGVKVNGVFIPTHFAPRNKREGYELIKAIKNETIFVVTEDLADMLKKMKYIVLPVKIKKDFRGTIEYKRICLGNWKQIFKGIRLINGGN